MDIFLDGYFHFPCYMEDDKIRQEITKVCHAKKEITCVVFRVEKIHRVHCRGAADKVRGSVHFLFVSGHHCPHQYQGPCPTWGTKMGKVLFLPSRCLWSIQGRGGHITGQFQPRVIRTFMRPVLIVGGHSGALTPRILPGQD